MTRISFSTQDMNSPLSCISKRFCSTLPQINYLVFSRTTIEKLFLTHPWLYLVLPRPFSHIILNFATPLLVITRTSTIDLFLWKQGFFILFVLPSETYFHVKSLYGFVHYETAEAAENCHQGLQRRVCRMIRGFLVCHCIDSSYTSQPL